MPGRAVDVSVVIPFRDAGEFLAETIESIIAQTLPGWELILVDDGSTDGTRRAAEAYAAEEPHRIRCVEHLGGANLGISASRNAGWARSTGRYVMSMDADDILLPHALETLAGALDRHAEAAAAQGRCVYWHSWRPAATQQDVVHVYPFATERVVHPPFLAAGPLVGSFAWPGTCALMYRRERLPESGPYDPSFRTVYEDLVAYAPVVLAHDVFVTNRVVSLYRQRPSSVMGSVSQEEEQRHREKVLEWVQRHVDTQTARDRRVQRWLRRARFLQAHPRLGRVRRSMQRLMRLARGYPPDLEERPPADALAHVTPEGATPRSERS